jgi:hypothetical protein
MENLPAEQLNAFRADLAPSSTPDEGAAMTMLARPVATNTGRILKTAAALLITFAATLVLVPAEICFSDAAIMQNSDRWSLLIPDNPRCAVSLYARFVR